MFLVLVLERLRDMTHLKNFFLQLYNLLFFIHEFTVVFKPCKQNQDGVRLTNWRDLSKKLLTQYIGKNSLYFRRTNLCSF